MKVLLAAVNAKYSHSSLAIRYLVRYCQEEFPTIEGLEYNINQDPQLILADIVRRRPDIVGISCYIWNIELILPIVSNLRKVSPRTTIILGGPEVSFDTEYWLKEYDAVDYLIAGEGEEALRSFLRAYQRGDGDIPPCVLSTIPGLVYRDKDTIRSNPQEPMDLRKIPPIYSGDLRELQNKIVYYETTRGCPFQCAYCLSSVMGRVREFPMDQCKEELRRLSQIGVEQVRFVDRTFNYDAERAYELLEFMIELDTTTRFQLEVSGDILTDRILQLLTTAPPNRFQFEIGVQSTNPETLKAVSRRSDLDRLREVVEFLRKKTHVRVLLDLIAGLPEEGFHRFGESFDYVYSLAPTRIHLGFLKLLRGSRLREEAESFGCVYTERAPYEVLQTDHVSYEELCRLHTIEDLVEKYVNGRFERSLTYLLRGGKSPFWFFNDFAIRWEKRGYHWLNHSQMSLYKILADFYAKENPDLVSYLRWDFRLHEPRRGTPQWMGGLSDRSLENELIRSNKIFHYLPELRSLPPREIGRRIFVEEFSFDGEAQTVLFYFEPGENKAHTFRLE